MIPPIVRLSTICLLAVGWSVCPPARAQEFSAPNADDLLRSLAVVIGPRPMGSPAERRALAFATEKLLLYGCDTAFVMPMMKAASVNTASGVAVGIKKGRTGRIIVLGGHIDSAGPEIPGANDDASGSAVVLEAARALSRDELQSTIVFALFGGEERGARGSRAFVEHFDGIDSVVLMIQIDMANGSGTIILDPDAHGASAPPWLVRATVEEFTGLGYTGLDYPLHYFSWNYATEKGSGSDHVPFLQAGIPAIDFTTDVGDPIHTPQDSYANFDPAGLKRSGDLALRLVRRFDGGVPSRATARYWLCLVGALPVIVPLWGVWFFVAGSALFGFAVLLRMRKAHFSVAPAGADQAGKRRWSGVKLLLVSLVTVLPAWYSSNLIGVIKNDRYPWFAHPEHYIVLGLLASVFGILTGLRLAGGLQISRSPYVLFKRSFIALLAAVVLAAFAGVKIAVPFAVCLLFLSSSLVLSLRLPAALIALVAPVWMFRLVFSEAYTLIFRLAAPGIPGTATAEIMVNGLWIGALTLLVFSWLPGFVAVARRHGGSGRLLGAIRSRRFLVITAGLFGIYTT
ncbi:MAG TPA: M20/M25/M40 family metallo-hydrolase, partial [Bacteroidota bacterium]|nr:M20/M25/M40 family metallo-hydrolase [Bacteroidota bacterium]